jgi:hypothetical protein
MTITGIRNSRNAALATNGEGVPIAVGVAGSYGAAGPLVAGTSNTPNTIDTVINKSFLINETNRSFFPGTRLRATAANFSNVWLEGIVTAWDGAMVTIDGDLASGTGAYSNWQINCAGQPGVQGAVGPVGPQGPSGGPAGPQGPQGVPGSVWRNGTGVPNNATGVNGDYWLDDSNGNVYQRAAGVYAITANITGPVGGVGAIGPVGPQGVPGSVWRNGVGAPASTLGVNGDYYLDTSNSNVYLKASGTYSIIANIQGNPGPTGPAGPTGPVGGNGPVGPAGPSGPGYAATSSSSLPIVLGSATLTTQSGLAYSAGARVRVSSAGAPTAWMEGLVTSYSGTSLIVNIDLVNGSGTYADWDLNVAGAQGSVGPVGPSGPGTGNVSNVGTPTNGQLAQWTGPTTIQGINPSSLGFAGLASPVFTGDPRAPTPATADNDTSIATTAFVKANLGTYLALTGGTLTGGLAINWASSTPQLNVNPPSGLAIQRWSSVTSQGTVFEFFNSTVGQPRWKWQFTGTESGSNAGYDFSIQRYDDGGALLGTPFLITRATGIISFSQSPTGPTPAAADNSLKLATTQFVAGSFAPLASPAFSGNPTAPTPSPGDNDTSIATTAFVTASFAPLASPIFTGTPQAPLPATASNDATIATTAWVKSLGYLTGGPYLTLGGGTLTGALTVQYANPLFTLIKAASGQNATLRGANGANARWDVVLGNSATETGSSAGSDFAISRYNDAGVFLDSPLTINRQGSGTTLAALTVNGQIFPVGGIVGKTDGSNAGVGLVGEQILASLPQTSASGIPNGGSIGVVSILLSQGDWDVSGCIGFTGGPGTLVNYVGGSISPTNGAMPDTGQTIYAFLHGADVFSTISAVKYTIMEQRYSVAAPTTIFLNGSVGYGAAGNVNGFGTLRARRIR